MASPMLAAAADIVMRESGRASPSRRVVAKAAAVESTANDSAALVQAARRGDRAAFARLHELYAPMVHGVALARVPVSDAADVVQDAFAHVLTRIHTLRDASAFGPWLASIARNLAIEFHRRRKVTQSIGADRAAVGHDDSQGGEALVILKVIRTLPDAYSETLVLRLVEGLTGPQIAASTGLTPGSVRVNLCRGMELLRERLAKRYGLEQHHER